jgi:integrase
MLFRLAAATGMRHGELLGLTWDHVHFDSRRIEVTRALNSVGYRLEFTALKTTTSRRNIAVDAATMTRLVAWRASRPTTSPQPAPPIPAGWYSPRPTVGPCTLTPRRRPSNVHNTAWR